MTSRSTHVTLSAQVQGYLDGMEKARKKTSEVGSEAEKLAQKKEAFELLGKTMAASGAVMAAGVAVAVNKFAEFDEAMSNANAVMQESAENQKLLRDAALEAGGATVYTATEAANAVEELAKAGIETSNVLGGALTGSLDLAASGQLEVARAAEITGITLKQFAMDGSQAGRVADVLSAGANKAVGSVEDLANGLKFVGPVTAGMNVSLEDTVATLALFADQGIIGEQAGTSLRGMLSSLTSPSKAAGKELDRLGITLYNQQGKFLGMENAADQLNKALAGVTDSQRDTSLGILFGNQQVTAARVLVAQGADAWNEYRDAVDDAGIASRIAEERLDNLRGDWEKLTGAIDTAQIMMGEAADGPLRFFTQELTSLVDTFNDMPDAGKQAVFWVGAAGAAALTAGGLYFMAVPKIAAYNAAIDNMGPTAQRASRLVGGAMKGLAVAGTITASVTALEMLGDALRGTETSAQELANGLTKGSIDKALAEAVQGTAFPWETDRVKDTLQDLGGVLDQMREGRPSSNSSDPIDIWFDQLAASVENVGDALATLDDPSITSALQSIQENFSLSPEQMLTLINGSDQLRERLIGIADGADLAATDSTLLKIALEGVRTPTTDAAAAVDALQAASEEAVTDLDELIEALYGVAGTAMAMGEAQDAALSSINALKEAAKGEKVALEGTNEASIKFRGSLRDVEDAHRKSAEAILNNGGTIKEARREWQDGRDAVLDQIEAMVGSREEARKWADENLGAASEVKDKLDEVYDAANRKAQLEIDVTVAKAALDGFIRTYNGTKVHLDVATDSLKIPGRATGGAIHGPGTGTSDTAGVYALSNGEHVLTASDVKALGGQPAVYAWRESLHSGNGPTSSKSVSHTWNVQSADPYEIAAFVKREEAWEARRW